MEVFLRCIEAVATTTNTTGFAAIKITALGRPSLLVGAELMDLKNIFTIFLSVAAV